MLTSAASAGNAQEPAILITKNIDRSQVLEPTIGQVSTHAGRYTPEFVRAVLDTVPRLCNPSKALECFFDDCQLPHQQVLEALAIQEQVDPQKIKESLMKLHSNLGHPSNADLVRVLKHGQASDDAIKMARDLSCDLCTARKAPTVANPGKASTAPDFNQRVGLDVKFFARLEAKPACDSPEHCRSCHFVPTGGAIL